jgi:hypothetical protein
MVDDFEDQIEKMMDVAQDAPNPGILAEDAATWSLPATTTAVWSPKGDCEQRCDGKLVVTSTQRQEHWTAKA